MQDAYTLEALRKTTQLLEATKITVVFKLNKVSAMCKIKGKTFGASGKDYPEAFEMLVQNVSSKMIVNF